jgi:hypothetical protein
MEPAPLNSEELRAFRGALSRTNAALAWGARVGVILVSKTAAGPVLAQRRADPHRPNLLGGRLRVDHHALDGVRRARRCGGRVAEPADRRKRAENRDGERCRESDPHPPGPTGRPNVARESAHEVIRGCRPAGSKLSLEIDRLSSPSAKFAQVSPPACRVLDLLPLLPGSRVKSLQPRNPVQATRLRPAPLPDALALCEGPPPPHWGAVRASRRSGRP